MRGAGRGARVRELLAIVGLPARRGVALPARVLRRPAAAHRHRARARGQSGLHRRRRAGVGARRLDPGADHQPARVAPAGLRRSPTSSSRTTSPSSATSPTGSRSCTSARSSRSSPADELYDNPLHPYTISLLSAVPIPDPVVERQRETILLQGDLPSPANPPRRAGSTRAARSCSRRSAATSGRSCASSRRGHVVACHWAEEIRAGELTPHAQTPVFDPGLVAAAPEPTPD